MVDRVALIPGGVGGLGLAVARELRHNHRALILTHRGADGAEERRVLQWLAGGTAEVVILRLDAATEEGALAAVEEAERRFGRLDHLIHAAGPYLADRPLAETTSGEWRAMVEGNLSSFFFHARAAIRMMRRQHYGRIIAFAYDEATEVPPWPGRGAYAAAKTGVLSLVRTLAVEEAGHGITVHAILPGHIRQAHKLWRREEALAARPAPVPVGRYGTGEDVARVVAFLLAETSDFLTGTAIPVTGGEPVVRRAWRKE